MTIKDFIKTVPPGIAALQGCKHSLSYICPDMLIIWGIKPVNGIMSRPGPFLLVKLSSIAHSGQNLGKTVMK